MQWVRCFMLSLVLLQAALTVTAGSRKNARLRHNKQAKKSRGNEQSYGSEVVEYSERPPVRLAASEPVRPPCCENLEMRRNIRLEQIKDKFLSATGLKTPPNMTGVVMNQNPNILDAIESIDTRQPQPAYMQEPPYNDDEPESKTDKIWSPAQEAPPPGINLPADIDVLYFKLNHDQLGSRVKRAILHVYLKSMMSELDRSVPVSVYKVVQPDNPDDPDALNRLTEVTTVSESFDGTEGNWVKIGVYKLVTEWLNRPEENLGLVVTAYDSQGRQVAVTNTMEDPKQLAVWPNNKGQLQPMLEIHTEENRRNRNRRNSSNNQCTPTNINEELCCRYPLVVNFIEMGWDFIVAPKVYEANFCNGDCPYLYAHKYAHSTLIQKMNSSNARYGPCCGARKLSPMKMLYYDHDHKIKFDTIQDMVVDRCGCS